MQNEKQGNETITNTATMAPITNTDDTNTRYEQIIEQLHTCCLCGSELKFHHETDYMMLTVREEAHCDSCGIRTKREAFSIQ